MSHAIMNYSGIDGVPSGNGRKRTLAALHNQLNQRFSVGVDRHPDCQNRRSSEPYAARLGYPLACAKIRILRLPLHSLRFCLTSCHAGAGGTRHLTGGVCPRQIALPRSSVVVQIAQVIEKTTFLSNLNDLKEPSSKSRAQKYL